MGARGNPTNHHKFDIGMTKQGQDILDARGLHSAPASRRRAFATSS
jgi:hypothetical protein